MIEIRATISAVHAEFGNTSVFRVITDGGERIRMIGDREYDFLPGEYRKFMGTWENHKDLGCQFCVKHSEYTYVAGLLIISFLTNQSGIGERIAKKLVDYFKDELPGILESEDVVRLTEVQCVGKAIATQAVLAWHQQAIKTQLIEFIKAPLERNPTLVRSLTMAVIKAQRFYQHKTIETLKDNPYQLWAFCSWKETDQLGLALGIQINDRRRLICAFEESLYRLYLDGHTAPSSTRVNDQLKDVLQGQYNRCLATFEAARDDGLNTKKFVVRGGGAWSLPASFIMETYVCSELIGRSIAPGKQLSFLESLSAKGYELPGGNSLDPTQEKAVNTILYHEVVAVVGAAGTGKTSVLYAANDLLHRSGRQVLQIALSGKAAQRLMQQTGQPAFTIESLLSKIKTSHKFLDRYELPVLFIDEAGMVDLPLIYRVLQAFRGRDVKIVFIGDRGQLAPIGPGLVFHKMIESKAFHVVELTTNYRALAGSNIPVVASMIRNGGEFAATNDVMVVNCSPNEVVDRVVDLYLSNNKSDSVQVISVTKRIMARVNRKLHNQLLGGVKPIEKLPEFRAGDRVIYKKNSPHIGIVNGSMGVVVETLGDMVAIDKNSEETVPADIVIEFELELEGRIALTASQVKNTLTGEWYLQHAYALTAHQAQGSEFDCVIIALQESQLLERSWLYTALTRAKQKVIIVGNMSLIQTAIQRGNKADERQVGLDFSHEN